MALILKVDFYLTLLWFVSWVKHMLTDITEQFLVGCITILFNLTLTLGHMMWFDSVLDLVRVILCCKLLTLLLLKNVSIYLFHKFVQCTSCICHSSGESQSWKRK